MGALVEIMDVPGSGNTYNVILSREFKGGTIAGVKLYIYDNTEENVEEKTILKNIGPGSIKSHEIILDEITNLPPSKIEVAPILLTDKGEEYVCQKTFTFQIL
jgi:hypothetical protein